MSLWWTHDSAKISAAARELLDDPCHEVLLNAVVAWEIAINALSASSRSATAWPSSWSEEGSVKCPSASRTPPRWSNSRHTTPIRSIGCCSPSAAEGADLVSGDESMRPYDVPVYR